MLELSASQSIILIIDDNATTIRLLSNILKNQGKILFATDGESGIRLARERKPQLILLDVEMPSMDGFEVCRQLKAEFDTRDCAVIFITANTSVESEVACLDAGAVDFISKPLNPPVVTARVKTHLRLQHNAETLDRLAKRDGLTGLFNRRFFDQAIADEFSRMQRQALPLGIALIDIDSFKNYNDAYGHTAGDAVLKAVAETINAAAKRPGEIVARYGGEEFVAILPYLNSEEISPFGDLLCQKIRELKLPHDRSTCGDIVTISVGLASVIPSERVSVKYLIDLADKALYLAKENGRNRSVLSNV